MSTGMSQQNIEVLASLNVTMDDTPAVDHILCPFCGHPEIEAKPGKTFCDKCNYHFYIDDRVECVFADPKDLRLPLKGTVCPICGLIQGEDSDHCVYCNTELNSNNNYC